MRTRGMNNFTTPHYEKFRRLKHDTYIRVVQLEYGNTLPLADVTS